MTGQQVVHADGGVTFVEMATERIANASQAISGKQRSCASNERGSDLVTKKRNKPRRRTSSADELAQTPIQRALLDEVNRVVTIVVDGQKFEVSLAQLVSRELLRMAANGSAHALSNAYNETVLAERLKRTQTEKAVAVGRFLIFVAAREARSSHPSR